ncbi:MAG: hypothetical protein WC318_07255, partial [Candidatus Omnitrophota bacterium]
WSSYFNFDKWLAAFRDLKIDPRFYLKQKDIEDILAWDFIDTGMAKDALIAEFDKIIAIE